jgi:hypothetical protein
VSGVPRRLAALVGEAVAGVPEAPRTLLGTAALLGPQPPVHLVAAVAGTSPLAVREAVAYAAGLVTLVREDLVVFAHELVREALVATLAPDVVARANAASARLGGHGLATGPRLTRRREDWVVTWGVRRAVVRDIIGMRYLARLVAAPGSPVAALDLVGPGRRGPSARRQPGTQQAERARVAVRKAITRAIEAIADADPAIAAELRATVQTGYACRYLPSAGAGQAGPVSGAG